MSKHVISLRRDLSAVDSRPDVALIKACATGEGRALATLYDRHHAVVRRYLSCISGVDTPILDDLVQETFMAVLQAAPSFRGDSEVRSLILGIAINRARHHIRGESRLRARLLRFMQQRSTVVVPSPLVISERKESMSRLRDAVKALPQGLREVFVLCDIQGERGVDVASILAIPEGTVYRRLHTARRKLRAALEQEDI